MKSKTTPTKGTTPKKPRAAKYEDKLKVDMNFQELLKATLPKNKKV